ncbi:hypothetical protein COCCADRAFT_87477 [Bipolaris zeicola 26-R-13]|uniref:Uncharacterized protein n=1 Tax=Cochliobolus carbonum (strain 26-R-13) TaxID=930089 RepID=W6YMN3_COCC2|nr:uncharacterized protein COCCADRAFT_87477 [Bipolaris zeicola 26-R-13]EUC36739.1 hypothetical protein COCCADRAFT_87477 [Bipolaris zeicola 26-R-13]
MQSRCNIWLTLQAVPIVFFWFSAGSHDYGLHGILQVAFLVRDDSELSKRLDIRLKSTMPAMHEWPCVSENTYQIRSVACSYLPREIRCCSVERPNNKAMSISDHIDEQIFLRSQCIVLLTRLSFPCLSAIPVKAGAWVKKDIERCGATQPK